MSYYFIATIKKILSNTNEYEDYIRQVKPIVETYGGRYLVRTDNITCLTEQWKPDRIIIIEFAEKRALQACFQSKEYLQIMRKREENVISSAIIVEGEKSYENQYIC